MHFLSKGYGYLQLQRATRICAVNQWKKNLPQILIYLMPNSKYPHESQIANSLFGEVFVSRLGTK